MVHGLATETAMNFKTRALFHSQNIAQWKLKKNFLLEVTGCFYLVTHIGNPEIVGHPKKLNKNPSPRFSPRQKKIVEIQVLSYMLPWAFTEDLSPIPYFKNLELSASGLSQHVWPFCGPQKLKELILWCLASPKGLIHERTLQYPYFALWN